MLIKQNKKKMQKNKNNNAPFQNGLNNKEQFIKAKYIFINDISFIASVKRTKGKIYKSLNQSNDLRI